jgi:hypothetical protein
MQGSVVLLVKTWKIAKKKFFRSIDLYRRGHYILGHVLHRGKKKIFHNVGFIFITTQEAPCVQREIFILGLLFLGAFCHKGKFICLKST